MRDKIGRTEQGCVCLCLNMESTEKGSRRRKEKCESHPPSVDPYSHTTPDKQWVIDDER